MDKLAVGAKLVNHAGETLLVKAKRRETELRQTYNITVAGNNNYFAGKLETLVHNCGPDGPNSPEFDRWRKQQTYEDAPYHTSGNSVKNPKPTNPDLALNNSYSIGENTSRRVGLDKTSGEFVVFDQTGKDSNVWHGHSRSWNDLNQQMKNALLAAGVVTGKGKIK